MTLTEAFLVLLVIYGGMAIWTGYSLYFYVRKKRNRARAIFFAIAFPISAAVLVSYLWGAVPLLK